MRIELGIGDRSRPRFTPSSALYALCSSFFMIGFDATVVNVAIPAITDSLDAGLNDAVWVNSAFALCYAVPLIPAGRLGDRFGPRRIFLIGLACFTLASLGCALAPTPETLIAARAVLGASAALVTPQTMSLIVWMFPVQRRGAALGVWGAVGGAAMAAGPVVGGVLVALLGWRSIFFVNVPIGLAALVAALVLVPERTLLRDHRLDLWGMVLSGVGLGALIFALQSGEYYDWGRIAGPVSIPAVFMLGAICLIGFVIRQRCNPSEPLVRPRLFADRDFSAASAAGTAMGAAMGGLFLP